MSNPKIEEWNDFWLFAKGHYPESEKNRYESIKTIQSHVCGFDIKYCSLRDISEILTTIVVNHAIKNNRSHRLQEVFKSIDPDYLKFFEDNRSHYERLIDSLLSYMLMCKCYNDSNNMILNIGKVDPELVKKLENLL